MGSSSVYLDYNATTPCDPRVVQTMLPYFSEVYGNAANGLHHQGRMAAKAINEARQLVAQLIGTREKEIIFTSGATESINLAILGLARINKTSVKKRIVTSAIEHKAVLSACKKLQTEGFEVVFLPVEKNGLVSLTEAKMAINKNTLLVTIQGANNEIGTIQPIAQLSEIAHHNGAIFHCDAAQAVGKISVNVDDWDVDLLSISAHKLYGPKGVGALYMRNGVRSIPIEPLWYGGDQEYGLRSGTSNVSGIVGFGQAALICQNEGREEYIRLRAFRDSFEADLSRSIPSLNINGTGASRLPNTSSLTFSGIDADALILNAPHIMMGTGSACTSGAIEPSHVLTAIGLSRSDASSTIRVSFGRFVEEKDISLAVKELQGSFNKLHPQ